MPEMITSWNQLQGHHQQRELLRRTMRQGRLAHAWVFSGPAGIGKRQFARLLAMSVFCQQHPAEELAACGTCRGCRGVLAGTWPDLHELERSEGRQEIRIGQLVGEGDRRGREGLCCELSMTPQASDRRVAIIDDAHCMTTEAANALLKTLEEPPARSLILLITDDAASLLPTVRSRCQELRFFALTSQEVKTILLNEGYTDSEDTAEAVAAVCAGSVETAEQLLDPHLRELQQAVARDLDQLDAVNTLNVCRTVLESIEQMSGSAAEQRQNAQWLLKFIAETVRRRLTILLAGDPGDRLTRQLGLRGGIDLLRPMLDRTIKASMQIDGMVPVPLAVAALFDELGQMLRRAFRDA